MNNIFGYLTIWDAQPRRQLLNRNPAQKVSGHKVSKIYNIGQKVSSQNYLNKDNEHYCFSYYTINSAVGSKANIKYTFFAQVVYLSTFLNGNFLSHVVNFGNFMAGNSLGRNLLGGYRKRQTITA